MGLNELARLVADQSGNSGIRKIDDFDDWYDREYEGQSIESLMPPRMVLVGLGVDDATERMVNFLVDTGVEISLVTFQGFEFDARTLLARHMGVDSTKAKPPSSSPYALTALTHKVCAAYRTFGIGKFHSKPWNEDLGYDLHLHSEELYASPEQRAGDAYASWLHREHPEYDHLEALMGERTEMYYMPQMSAQPAHCAVEGWAAARAVEQLRFADPRPWFGFVSFVAHIHRSPRRSRSTGCTIPTTCPTRSPGTSRSTTWTSRFRA